MLNKVELVNSKNINLSYMCYKVIATIAPYQIEGLPMLELCKHKGLIDTGVEYYHCPMCNEGWKYVELPNQEEEIEQLAKADYKKYNLSSHHGERTKQDYIDCFTRGYKAAQSKKFSEDDMRIAITKAYMVGVDRTNYGKQLENDILQSLQKKQFPIAVKLDNNMNPLKWYYNE